MPPTLRSLIDWPDEITLVPYSGLQILDFGFDMTRLEMKPWKFIERLSEATDDAPPERTLIPLSGDPEKDEEVDKGAREDDDPYSVRPIAALEPFLMKWVPVPVLRLKSERGSAGEERYDPGPSSWARMRVVELAEPDAKTGHTHRVQLGFDTNLVEANPGHYVAPERGEAINPREFRLVSDPAHMDWFLRRLETAEDGSVIDLQIWVSNWLKDLFLGFKRAERPGRQITEESLPHQFEHWSRYLAYLQLIDRACRPPKIRFADTISGRDEQTPVDVELVLDVGNSRTCGILIERFPGETQVDLARSYPLELRDLSRPEFQYTGLFESRVEFTELRFGDERFASRSGRRNAFVWPSFVRVGPEAIRLTEGEEGTETLSGLSSPKRYLWDDGPMEQDWRFHNHDDPNNLPKSVRSAMRYLNEAGDVIEQVQDDIRQRLRRRGVTSDKRAIRPRFSRSSLFGFMLAEFFAHALVQVNDPAARSRRPQSNLPRRLKRIILTLPTATSVQEQAIMRSRAKGALCLVWSLLGIGEIRSAISDKPVAQIEWDEASCTQLVYLYSELTQKFDGRIEKFLDLKGRRRSTGGAAPEPTLRLASIDIGGGTTDLMVTSYTVVENRELRPHQLFREGFRIAGDDLLQRVISSIVLPQIKDSVQAAGGRYIAEKLTELFGGNVGGQDQQQVQKRRQFGLRILMPIAEAIIAACEVAGEADRIDLSIADLLGLAPPAEDNEGDIVGIGVAPAASRPPPPALAPLLDYIERPAAELGAVGWRLTDLTLNTHREDVDAVAREVFQKVLGNMTEVLDHLKVDVVLLTGRPSRLPAVRSVIEELLAVPPHRLVSMHTYKTGRWYPFRDPITQRIGDPKSTVAVGGMLIALSEGRIPNFKVATNAFQMKSTARFVGEMDSSGQIMNDRVHFSDIDLDGKGGQQTATINMFAPIHIGARQLPIERWTTTPLFRLDFTPGAQRRPTPIKVTLEKADFDDGDIETAEDTLRREAQREAFTVTEVEDGVGDGMKVTEVSLRLHTLGFEDEYWIDTGVFRI